MQVAVGEVVEGKVTGITNFGAFIALPEGKNGLVHISEVSEGYVKDIREHLAENQVVRVRVMTIEPSGKIGLSIKRAAETVEREKAPADHRTRGNSFEDKLSKFIKDSTEKQNDIKRNFESKRGGGFRK
jgi:S1 RNA binding domain protein